MSPKVPRTPPHELSYTDDDVVPYSAQLWRIHNVGGKHPSRWDELRTFGPVDSRWDPHPEPRGVHLGHGVAYAAPNPTTSFGEVFQRTRRIDLTDPEQYLTGWRPARELRLLDLTDTWPSRQGAAGALSAAPKPVCRAWARAIFDELVLDGPRVDGLRVTSTITNRPMVVLYDPAADSYPAAPAISRPLSHDDLVPAVDLAVEELGYGLVAPPGRLAEYAWLATLPGGGVVFRRPGRGGL